MLYSIYFLYFFADLTPDPIVQNKASEVLVIMLYVALAINFVFCVLMSYIDILRANELS